MKTVVRVLDLMRWILEQKFMTGEQIRKLFWKGQGKESTEEYRRLRELLEEGFLKKGMGSNCRYVLYLVTAKGVKLLKCYGKHQGLSEVCDVGDSNYNHDIAVTDLRIMFYEWGYKEWVSERVLSKRNDLRYLPDGIIHHRGKNYAVEYEATLKSRDRYREIFLHYLLEDQVDKVLYVTNSEEMIGKMSLQKIRDKICFTTIQDLQEHKLDAPIKGMESACSLRELLEGTA